MMRWWLVGALSLTATFVWSSAEEKTALFGDLHVHTRYSYDAFFFGTLASPDDAYRFAQGEPIDHPAGIRLQLDRPLDFYAVTDHAYFLGQWWAIKTNPDHPLADDPAATRIAFARTTAERAAAFGRAFRFPWDKLSVDDMKTAWRDIQGAAARHYRPGEFTTFVAFEFTPEPNMDGLHRNVIFRGTRVPDTLLSRIDTLNPELLWDWMDRHRENGIESLAIPHNMNLSNGRMFEMTTFSGAPLDAAYAEQRQRNEPLVEITQVKGTSDTHPFLSPNDEWADFEIAPYKLGGFNKSKPQGSYVRDAWQRGLLLEERGFNPYRFGVVGASDTHHAGERFDESKFVGKVGDFSSSPISRGSIALADGGYRETASRYYGSSGLAGVWATANDRESIFAAFRRKETFATSGPRIQLRLTAAALDRHAVQGGELRASASPVFTLHAIADPMGRAKLARLQIIKGWTENGVAHETVVDVACSDGATPNAGRCPDNGARVDVRTCAVSAGVGDAELTAAWTDPDFDVAHRAFYYARVLQNPICRWSTWDAIRKHQRPRPDLPATIQERAWSSPIWVNSTSGI